MMRAVRFQCPADRRWPMIPVRCGNVLLMSGLRLLCITLIAASPLAAMAAPPNSTLVFPLDRLEQLGLTEVWRNQADVDPAFGHLVDAQLSVDAGRGLTRYVISYGGATETRTRTKVVMNTVIDPDTGEETPVQETLTEEYQVSTGGRTEVISELDLGPRGTPYGKEGARAAADLRVEILAAEGYTASVAEETTPRITLYLLSDQFVVQAIDAETGATRWSARVGERGSPPGQLAVTEDYVCLVNNMNLYCLESTTGREIWKRRMRHSAGAGVAISAHFVHVPMINGSMEVFSLLRPKAPSEQTIFSGRAMTRPLVTPSGLAWASDTKALFLGATGEEVSAFRFRLTFEDGISDHMTVDDQGGIFVPTLDGSIRGVSDRLGKTLWKRSLGETLRDDLICIGEDLFAITVTGSLHALDKRTGESRWSASGIDRFVSATESKVYVIDRVGDLRVLDRVSGTRLGHLPLEGSDFVFANRETDRLFVGTRSGRLVCLREIESRQPRFHRQLATPAAAPTAEPPVVEPGPAPRPAVEDDPFGVGR